MTTGAEWVILVLFHDFDIAEYEYEVFLNLNLGTLLRSLF